MRAETVTAPPAPILLIVSDDPSFIAALEETTAVLKSTGWTLTAKSYEGCGLETLAIFAEPDCILLDSAIFKDSNNTRFTAFQQRFSEKYIPIVAIADPEESESLAEQLTIADEIVRRGLGGAELAVRVNRHEQNRRKLMDLMTIDPVTGAFSVKYLHMELQKQLNEMKRSHEPFSMVYAELDDLTSVSRTHGYPAAESMMKQFVGFFQHRMRPADTISRFGGGFILVLPLTVKEDAMKFMKRMMQELKPAFSAKVVEFTDASLSPEACLAQMPFETDEISSRGEGSLIDGTAAAADSYVRKFNIAIIDDDRIIRELLSQQLSDIGDELYEVEIRSYADGEEFFNDPWHRQNERFVVIIDRIMPKMDGLEVLQTIRSNYDRRRYICVMLTNRDSETEIAQAIQRGANDYVKKPFSLQELRARLMRLMRGMR